MSENNAPAIQPAYFFRSFLLVAGSYVVNSMLVAGAAVAILAFAFPDSIEILNLEPEKYKVVFEESPDKVFPPSFLWILLGVSCLISFVIGYFIARQAPIAKFGHAIFLATILFVQYLQFAISATDTMQRMFVLFMAATPIATIIGANQFLASMGPADEEPIL